MLDNKSAAAPDTASHAETDASEDPVKAQRLNGVVDVSRPGRVVGWAIDRSDPDAAVEVEIFRDGRRIATVRADRHREDLVRNGIGTGNYGFVAELDPAVEPGMAFAVTAIARAADGTRGPLRPIGKAAPSSDPDRRILERTFEELISLRVDVARLKTPAPGSTENAVERLREMLERIEVVQARLEATDQGRSSETPSRSDPSLRVIAGAALGIALGSLALGVFSMWVG